MKDHLRVAAVALAAIIVFQVAREGYRWFAFRDERQAIVRLRKQVVDAGAELTSEKGQLDALGRQVQQADSGLNADVEVLRRYSLHADGGLLPPPLYARYVEDRKRYEQRLAERQALFERWQHIDGRFHAAVNRYGMLSDSIRGLAARIGEPYYPVPLPVEAAAERGLIKVDSGTSR